MITERERRFMKSLPRTIFKGAFRAKNKTQIKPAEYAALQARGLVSVKPAEEGDKAEIMLTDPGRDALRAK